MKTTKPMSVSEAAEFISQIDFSDAPKTDVPMTLDEALSTVDALLDIPIETGGKDR